MVVKHLSKKKSIAFKKRNKNAKNKYSKSRKVMRGGNVTGRQGGIKKPKSPPPLPEEYKEESIYNTVNNTVNSTQKRGMINAHGNLFGKSSSGKHLSQYGSTSTIINPEGMYNQPYSAKANNQGIIPLEKSNLYVSPANVRRRRKTQM